TTFKLTINNTLIPTIRNPKILGFTLNTKLNFKEHTKLTKAKADKSINILKTLTTTKWGKQENILATYKALTRPIIEYASTIWSPIVKPTNIAKLQTTQNTALRIATGCTADTNTNHIHQETKILPLPQHLKLHASQLRQKAKLPSHPLNPLLHQAEPPR